MKIVRLKEIEIYRTRNGEMPFTVWLESLKDTEGRFRIKERLERISLGNMGDYKYLSNGVSEFRFGFGPGYRIYFGEDGNKLILLLCGGDKTSQKRDIKKAVKYWKDYLMR